MQMCREVAENHDGCRPERPKRKRGRPIAKRPVKRRRIDGWNVFVKMQPCSSGAAVKSGAHLKRCAREWKAMRPDQKAVYHELAAKKKKELDDAAAGGSDASDYQGQVEPESESAAFRGPWGLGDDWMPLSAEFMDNPPFERIASDLASWLGAAKVPIRHIDGSLPFKNTIYNTPCAIDYCCQGPHFGMAQQLRDNFLKAQKWAVCDVILLLGGSEDAGPVGQCGQSQSAR